MRRAWEAAPRARWFVVAALVVAAIGVVELASGGGSSEETGRAAPPLPTKALRPPGVDLAALRGKPALIDFFASWCDPCAEEAPTLRKLSTALGDQANVVAVDWNDSAGPARAFVRKHGWTFPVLSDPNGSVGIDYGVTIGLPTSFVLDPQGQIVERFLGPQSEATLSRALREAA